jgi:hypothetical protein
MIVQQFQPRTYYNTKGYDTNGNGNNYNSHGADDGGLVTHRYQVFNNYHLVELPSLRDQQQLSNWKPTSPEIQLIFAPSG